MNPQLTILQADLQTFCRAHAVRELSVFGSAVRGDFGADSDVDVLIDMVAWLVMEPSVVTVHQLC